MGGKNAQKKILPIKKGGSVEDPHYSRTDKST
jgi:hypothetical protein